MVLVGFKVYTKMVLGDFFGVSKNDFWRFFRLI